MRILRDFKVLNDFKVFNVTREGQCGGTMGAVEEFFILLQR